MIIVMRGDSGEGQGEVLVVMEGVCWLQKQASQVFFFSGKNTVQNLGGDNYTRRGCNSM